LELCLILVEKVQVRDNELEGVCDGDEDNSDEKWGAKPILTSRTRGCAPWVKGTVPSSYL